MHTTLVDLRTIRQRDRSGRTVLNMKSGPLLLTLTLLVTTVHAQDDAIRNLQLRETEQRAWISDRRASYDGKFKAQEALCYQRFAVNDCLIDSRQTQREVMADLRRQEILINDAQRKRRGALQLLRSDEKLTNRD